MISLFKHLLPRARAWSITIDGQLRQLFDGLALIGTAFKSFIDLIWFDIFPNTTREIDQWETQFGLIDSSTLPTQDRIDRLDAAWKEVGGQDPRYIQDTLQAAGFDAYVHEWWDPAQLPSIVARNPLDYINRTTYDITYLAECGELLAECGELTAECGDYDDTKGYALVNLLYESQTLNAAECGGFSIECGEPDSMCGFIGKYTLARKNYFVPSDSEKHPYFLYIAGQTWPNRASIPLTRRVEFERLCLRICPTQQWIAVMVDFT